MKTPEEIQHLAEKSVEDVKKDHADYRFREVYKEFYIDGYTQCQEDMVGKKYTEEDLHNLLRARRQLYSHTDKNVVRDFINSLNKQD